MADVFISYKSERRAAAEHLAEILTDYGYTVWWDYGLISGRDFGAQIEKELRAAKAVVVLWCSMSVDSEWVREEAALAKRLNRVIPTFIEKNVDLPLGFSLSQTLDLADWDGSPKSAKLDRLLRDILANSAAVRARKSRKTAAEHDGAATTATPAQHGRPWTHSRRARRVRERSGSGDERAGHTKTVVVVAVRRRVPVAVRRAEDLRIVVPRTAAKDTRRGSRPGMRPATRAAPRRVRADEFRSRDRHRAKHSASRDAR